MNKQAVIFDYGAVLSTHPTREDYQPLADLCGLPRDRFYDLFWIDRVEYDRGALTAREYWGGINAQAGRPLTEELVQQLVNEDVRLWLTLHRPMIEYVRLLKRSGFRTAVLSNMPRELGVYLHKHSGLFSLFDFVTLSYEVGAVKPEEQIYLHCVDGLGVDASQAVFLDDRIANVQGSERFGMAAFEFHSPKQFGQDAPARYGLPLFNLMEKEQPFIDAREVR